MRPNICMPKPNTCMDCGRVISRYPKRCRGCAFKNREPFGFYKIRQLGPKCYSIAVPKKWVEEMNLMDRYYKINIEEKGRVITFRWTEND